MLHIFVAQGATVPMNLDLSAAANKVRISQITFLGKCSNCDKIVDVSQVLPTEKKQTLARKYGFSLKGRTIVCNKVLDIGYCRTCAIANS